MRTKASNLLVKLFLLLATVCFLSLAAKGQTQIVYRNFNPSTGVCLDTSGVLIYQTNSNFTQGLYSCISSAYTAFNMASSNAGQGYGINVKLPPYNAVGNGVANDTTAIQAAINAARSLTAGTVYFPAGTYNVAGLVCLECKSITFLGDGPDNTKISVTTANVPALAFNGAWRNEITGLQFISAASNANGGTVEFDGNYDGTHTLSVQGNHITHSMFIGASLAKYALAWCRQGGSNAQCSENLMLNINADQALRSGIYNNGFNALANTVIGGNLQSNALFGIETLAGSFNVINTGIQNWPGATGYSQIANGGYDIDASTAGVGERIIVMGVRSEDLAFYHGSGSQLGVLIGNQTTCGTCQVWQATTAYTSNQVIVKASVTTGLRRLYRVTTPGTSAGAEGTWPESGTKTDGSVVWTMTAYNVVNAGVGSISLRDNNFQSGDTLANNYGISAGSITASSSLTPPFSDQPLSYTVNATGGNITITLPAFWNFFPSKVPIGAMYYLKRTDSSGNTVTVVDDSGSSPDGVATTIPPLGYLILYLEEDSGGQRLYRVLSAIGALTTNPLSQFAATTSAQLRSTISDELGTGALLFDGATPTSFVLTNATGLPLTSGVAGILPVANGGTGQTKTITVRAFNNASQSIPDATTTVVTLNSERYDTDTIHSTSVNTGRLTATTAGTYAIGANIEFPFSVLGYRIVVIRLNGTTFIGQTARGASNAALSLPDLLTLDTQYQLAAGDFVEIVVFQNSGGALNVTTDSNVSPEFYMTRLGP